MIPERVLWLTAFWCGVLKNVCDQPLNVIIIPDIYEGVVAVAFLHVQQVDDLDHIALCHQQGTDIPEHFRFRVQDHITAAGEHQGDLGKETSLTGTTAADTDDIQIPPVLSAVQAKEDVLGQWLVVCPILQVCVFSV